MTDIHIRLAEGYDIPKILAIGRASSESSQWSVAEYARVISAAEGTEECLVAAADDFVAGFVVTRTVADEMEILNLAVAPQRRRQGIATALLQHTLAAAAQIGALRAFLEVRESNAAARAFYARHGFTESGRRRAYYTSPVEDAILLTRAVTPRP